MQQGPSDRSSLVRKTVLAVVSMVGACVAFVGTITLVAVLALGKASAASSSAAAASEGPVLVPTSNVHGVPGSQPAGTGTVVPLRAGTKPDGSPAQAKGTQMM